MTDKLEMSIEQFAEAVAKENARLNERIEKLETALNHTMECFIKARAALKDCIIERDEARKALEGKKPLEWTENHGQGSEPWLNKE